MKKQYGSFLIRCWRLSDQTYRIEIEHVQSGEKADTASLEAIQGWMEAHIPSVMAGQPSPPCLTIVPLDSITEE